jgi:hypothetical protein
MKKENTFLAMQAVWIPILILSCLLYGCEISVNDDEGYGLADESYNPRTQNIIFYNTSELFLEIQPNVAEPTFAWTFTGSRYIVITIFRAKIDLRENQIANTEDAVWTWNTGLGKGREGNVSFSDGQDVIDGEIQSTTTPLSPGMYYIAAWGYDDRYNLIYSSKEYPYEYTP